MRIAMIGSRGIPARWGGVERVVEELARELSSRGHEVLVYGRRWYLADAGRADAGKVIVTAGLRGKALDTITHTATAMLDVRRRGVDVVHIHSPGPALLSWMPRLAGLPIVLTVHAADWRRDKWFGPAKLMLKLGLMCGMKVAGAVTAVSGPLAAELARSFGREVLYVPNAVHLPVPTQIGRIAQWGLKPDDYLLYVGRIVPEKRLDLLLCALSRVETQRKIVVAAELDNSRYCRRCRALAGPGTLFVGPQYGQVLSELYACAALVVQPSVLEGMSLVLLEAAAHGRCVLAADIPENREIMGESILYFSTDNIDELAMGINRSLEQDDLRRELGRKARALVSGKYSWSEVASQMENVYNHLQ
jgi:glycosyltransferase involved in cell wall biosynthesis